MSETPGEVLVTSRSFAEYVAFFNLDPDHLPRAVLDCSAGASSFVSEACRRGVNAIALDPAYDDRDRMLEQARASVAGGAQLISDNQDRFVYDWYGSPGRREEMRAAALSDFIDDFSTSPERYLPASLPGPLPFEAGSFDLALCSHLLFTWADEFDEDWHFASLVELARVAREVRVFPLVLKGSGSPVEFLPRLQSRLRSDFGVYSNIVSVGYEFQRGANQMLRLAPTA